MGANIAAYHSLLLNTLCAHQIDDINDAPVATPQTLAVTSAANNSITLSATDVDGPAIDSFRLSAIQEPLRIYQAVAPFARLVDGDSVDASGQINLVRGVGARSGTCLTSRCP